MKKETLQYRTKIANDIMYYIYTHIDTNITIDELSFDMKISKFHMQRIFKEIFGKNIYETIKSIRLQKASSLLLTNKYSTISQIANLCGYSSHSSFIKAFTQRFGMSPKQWKNDGYKIYSEAILQESLSASSSTAEFSNIEYEIVKMPKLQSYYIRHQGYTPSVKQTWQKMHAWILSNDIQEYQQIALLHDNPTVTPLQECQYIACVIPKDKKKIASDRLPTFTISDGVYAKFDLEGKRGDLLKFIHFIYHEWLLKSEFETTTKPSYVIYHKNNFLSSDQSFDISFYLSINF